MTHYAKSLIDLARRHCTRRRGPKNRCGAPTALPLLRRVVLDANCGEGASPLLAGAHEAPVAPCSARRREPPLLSSGRRKHRPLPSLPTTGTPLRRGSPRGLRAALQPPRLARDGAVAPRGGQDRLRYLRAITWMALPHAILSLFTKGVVTPLPRYRRCYRHNLCFGYEVSYPKTV